MRKEVRQGTERNFGSSEWVRLATEFGREEEGRSTGERLCDGNSRGLGLNFRREEEDFASPQGGREKGASSDKIGVA